MASGRLGVAALLAAGVALAGCADTGNGPSTPAADGPVVVTFEVAGGERFRTLLTEPADVATARRLLASEDVPGIPNGLIVRETGINEGWSWSLDPNDFEFADVTVEVCDGLPSDVESGDLTSDRYCPWSAVIVGLVPAP